MSPEADARLAELLEHPRYEVIPVQGIVESVLEAVPTDVTVTVTASPTKGLDATLDAAVALAGHGYPSVPHVSARLVRDREHLTEIVARLREADVDEVFVVAGDAETAAGAFDGAASLLRALAELGHPFRRVGITGYPESHPFISDEETIAAMFAKAEHATYVASQICFDPAVTVQWITNVWARGTRLPIHVGIPGAVSTTKLLRISTRIGLGDSVRFLRKHALRMSRLLVPGHYQPDGLIDGLAPCLVDPERKVAGFHVFTFNELAETEKWRQRRLEQILSARR